MVHAGPEDAEPSLAAQRIIARENDHGVGTDQGADDQLGKQLPELVEIPGRLEKNRW